MSKQITDIEDSLYRQELATLAKVLDAAVNAFRVAFAPYVGYNVMNDGVFHAQATAFNTALAQAFGTAVALRMTYYAGYSTALRGCSFAGLLDSHLPDEVKKAIRSVASEAFLKKVEDIQAIAETAQNTAENIANEVRQ